MAHWRTRKDGTHYKVQTVLPKGMDRETLNKLINQDANRSATARTIDKHIRAPLDLTGERWAKKPNRYDFPGIDDPKSGKKFERQTFLDNLRKSK
jgi:hypothetical protein